MVVSQRSCSGNTFGKISERLCPIDKIFEVVLGLVEGGGEVRIEGVEVGDIIPDDEEQFSAVGFWPFPNVGFPSGKAKRVEGFRRDVGGGNYPPYRWRYPC